MASWTLHTALTWSLNWREGQVEICPQLPELVCTSHSTVLVWCESPSFIFKKDKISCQGLGWLVQSTLMGHLVKQGGSRCCFVSTHAALDRLGVLLSFLSLGKSGLWMCRKHAGPYKQQLEKRQGILLILLIYWWAPKVAVWPEALMGLFERRFRECFGGFSPGQGCHWCERNFSLGVKACV